MEKTAAGFFGGSVIISLAKDKCKDTLTGLLAIAALTSQPKS